MGSIKHYGVHFKTSKVQTKMDHSIPRPVVYNKNSSRGKLIVMSAYIIKEAKHITVLATFLLL